MYTMSSLYQICYIRYNSISLTATPLPEKKNYRVILALSFHSALCRTYVYSIPVHKQTQAHLTEFISVHHCICVYLCICVCLVN